MLNQLLGKNYIKDHSEISKERIKEIFEVPETKEKWQQLNQNSKFKKFVIDSSDTIEEITSIVEKIARKKEEILETNIIDSQIFIVNVALSLVACKGILLNEAVQESLELIIKEVESVSEEEVEEILDGYFSKFRDYVLMMKRMEGIIPLGGGMAMMLM